MMKFSKPLLAGALSVASVLPAVSARASAQSEAGAVLGAIIGGVIGHEAGRGEAGATVLGAILGGAVGATIGRELDEADRRAIVAARARSLNDGGYVDWRGADHRSRTGAIGRIAVTREGYARNDSSRRCREYTSEIRVRGRVERTTGQACVDRNGNWAEVTSTQVIYGRSPATRPAPRPVPVPPPVLRPVPGGGYDGGHGGGHGHPGHAAWDVADVDVLSVINELRSARWDSDRIDLIQTYVDFWSRRGQRLNSIRLAEILGTFTYDSDRVRATRVLRRILIVNLPDAQRALATFRFSSDREEARRILLN